MFYVSILGLIVVCFCIRYFYRNRRKRFIESQPDIPPFTFLSLEKSNNKTIDEISSDDEFDGLGCCAIHPNPCKKPREK